MPQLSELAQVLHEEHFRILALLCSLESRVVGPAGDEPLDPRRPDDRLQLSQVLHSLDQVIDHNAFEEAVLFPLLSERGGSDLAGLLVQEHLTIGPVARRLRDAARTILERGVADGVWPEFRAAAQILVVEMMLHLQKEELAVVQHLSSFIDPETDRRLALAHLAERPPMRCPSPLVEAPDSRA